MATMPQDLSISVAAKPGTDVLLSADQGERKQPMRGYDDTYVDIVDFIVRVTHRIWEEKDIGHIYDCYRHNARVTVAGIVVARQRPGTAKGIVFMLLEDEAGTINLVVPPEVYERHRTVVRSEPLIVAEGKLERHPAGGGQINVLVATMRGLDGAQRPAAEVKDFSMLDEAELARQRDGDFRAVAPPVQSFASGRRR